MIASSGAYLPDVKCSVDFGWWSVTFCWGYGEPALLRLWQILSRHFTLYVMRRVWVVTLHCMLCAESEWLLYIVCYAQSLSGHFALYVMRRFWVVTLHCMLCAELTGLHGQCYGLPSGPRIRKSTKTGTFPPPSCLGQVWLHSFLIIYFQ